MSEINQRRGMNEFVESVETAKKEKKRGRKKEELASTMPGRTVGSRVMNPLSINVLSQRVAEKKVSENETTHGWCGACGGKGQHTFACSTQQTSLHDVHLPVTFDSWRTIAGLLVSALQSC